MRGDPSNVLSGTKGWRKRGRVQQARVRRRVLRCERLEPRMVLSGGEHVLPLQVDPSEVAITGGNPAAPTEENASLSVSICVDGAVDIVQVDLSDGWSSGNCWSKRLTDGESASYAIKNKSLADLLGTKPNGQIDVSALPYDALYGASVKITRVINRVGVNPERSEESYYISRFVSALEPGTNIIRFPATGPSITRRKRIEVVDPSRASFGLVELLTGESFRVQTDGLEYTIDFAPNVDAKQSFAGAAQVIWRNEAVGTLTLMGTSVAMPKWWIDKNELAGVLKEGFRCYQDTLCQRPARDDTFYQELAAGIVRDVDQFLGLQSPFQNRYWQSNGMRADRLADAAITVRTNPILIPGTIPSKSDYLIPSDWSERVASVLASFDELNPSQQIDAVDRLLDELRDRNAERKVPIRLNLNGLMDETGDAAENRRWFWEDADSVEAANYLRRELAKVISHELGHAMGFVGHITPRIAEDETGSSRYDVMQEGSLLSESSVGTDESGAFFRIMLGNRWKMEDLSDMVELMRNRSGSTNRAHEWDKVDHTSPEGTSANFLVPRTNDGNPTDANGDGIISPFDILYVIEDLVNLEGARFLTMTMGDLPPYPDVSGDGMLSPKDILTIVSDVAGGTTAEGEPPAVAEPNPDPNSWARGVDRVFASGKEFSGEAVRSNDADHHQVRQSSLSSRVSLSAARSTPWRTTLGFPNQAPGPFETLSESFDSMTDGDLESFFAERGFQDADSQGWGLP